MKANASKTAKTTKTSKLSGGIRAAAVKGTAANRLTAEVKSNSSKGQQGSKRQQQIEQKAFEIFQLRGAQPGLEQFDWSVAEVFVELESKVLNNSQKAKKAADIKNLQEKIQKKAYELFEKKGRVHGSDQADWYIAKELVVLEGN